MAEIATEKKTVDLQAFFAEQDEIARKIAVAEQVVVELKTDLQTAKSTAQEKIVALLGNGGTTGNLLHDEIVRELGVDRDAINRISAFSDRLVQAKGAELLIAVSYQKRMRFGGPGDTRPDDYMTCWGYIFGKLSGERLELTHDPKAVIRGQVITLPFERYLQGGFEHMSENEADVRIDGKLSISTYSFASDLTSLAEYIIFGHTIVGIEFEYAGQKNEVLVYIGDEVNEHNLLKVQLRIGLRLEDLRAKLNVLTPAEQATASHI